MDKMTNFKEFVKENPILVKYVKNNDMTWQKFYELFDLYGKDDNIWNDYLNNEPKEKVVKEAATTLGFADILGWLKNIDMDSLQENINSVSRVVGVLQDLGKNDNDKIKPEYKPRPLYKHFED